MASRASGSSLCRPWRRERRIRPWHCATKRARARRGCSGRNGSTVPSYASIPHWTISKTNWGDTLAEVNAGSIATAVTLSYIDYRLPDLGWRNGAPAAPGLHDRFVARESAWRRRSSHRASCGKTGLESGTSLSPTSHYERIRCDRCPGRPRGLRRSLPSLSRSRRGCAGAKEPGDATDPRTVAFDAAVDPAPHAPGRLAGYVEVPDTGVEKSGWWTTRARCSRRRPSPSMPPNWARKLSAGTSR